MTNYTIGTQTEVKYVILDQGWHEGSQMHQGLHSLIFPPAPKERMSRVCNWPAQMRTRRGRGNGELENCQQSHIKN